MASVRDTALVSDFLTLRSLTSDQCVSYMTSDLQNENLLYRPEISREWNKLRNDIKMQQWDTVLSKLTAFEKTVQIYCGYRLQDATSRFRNYFYARQEVLQKVTQHATQRQTITGKNPTASISGTHESTQVSIQQSVQNMENDLNYNYCLVNAEVNSRWQALRQDLVNQQWHIVPTKLEAFEETFNRIYGGNYEKKLSHYQTYWSARNEMLQRIKDQQNVQKHTAVTSITQANIPRTQHMQESAHKRQIDIEQCLKDMESDLKGSRNYLCTGPISEAWKAFRSNFRDQQWSTALLSLRTFEEHFLKIHGYPCETHRNLFPRYTSARDQIQQKIEELTVEQKESASRAAASVAPQSSSLNTSCCLQTMEYDLKNRYNYNYLWETTLQTKWNAFRRDLEKQRWTIIQQTLEDFEKEFYRIHRFQLKDSSDFSNYTEQRKAVFKAKEDAISKSKDLWGIGSFDEARSSQTKEETPFTNDLVVIEGPSIGTGSTNISLDAEYLQMCIKWLEESLKQSDESAVQHPIKAGAGVTNEAVENAKRLEDIYKSFIRLKQQNSTLILQKQRLDDEIAKSKQELQRFQTQVQTSENMKEKMERLQTETNLLQQKLNSAESDKQYWMNRVSKVAGTKLTTNNPGITDLSDPNRPQKLAEKFGELYDNTWTDALEQLVEKTRNKEDDNIKRLALLLQNCYAYCHKLSVKHIKDLQSVLMTLAVDGETNGDAEIPKNLLDARKETAYVALGAVRQKTMQAAKRAFPTETELIPDYIESCIDICWGMVVHEPKLCFLWLDEGKDKFVNLDQFSFYTRSGPGVEFLVWPAMLLHENGPVLRKGTYQPFEDKKFR